MIKILFILLSLLFSIASFATCKTKVNPRKVILFVDTSDARADIEAVRKVACERGERLVVVPKKHAAYDQLIKRLAELEEVLGRCQQTKNQSCLQEERALDKAYSAFKNFKDKQPSIADQIRESLNELRKTNSKLVNFSISGHDGGGHFGGEKGNFNRGEIADILQEFSEVDQTLSLLLLGCYTGVAKEVKEWRKIFPKVKLIGGYDGVAPRSTRPQGHAYIRDILLHEKKLLSEKDPNQVDARFKQLLPSLENLNSAIWVDPRCSSEGKGFYYGSELGRTFKVLDISMCEKGFDELSKVVPAYTMYSLGNLEPPSYTGPESELRKIYDLVRTYQSCLETEPAIGAYRLGGINPNSVFNLLFWHDLKKNFGEYYDEEMERLRPIVEGIDFSELERIISQQIQEKQGELQFYQKELDELTADPEKYSKIRSEAYQEALRLENEFLKDPKAAELVKISDQVVLDKLSPEDKALLTKAEVLKKNRKDAQDRHFYSWLSLKSKIFDSKNLIEDFEKQKRLLQSVPLSELRPFVPTKAIVGQKTRKEILENSHRLHRLLQISSLTPQQREALDFIYEKTESRFRYFENPFSWHEYTGRRPEDPDAPVFNPD